MSLPPKPRPRYIPDFDEWCDNLDDKSIFVEDALHRWRAECEAGIKAENEAWRVWRLAASRATEDERLDAGDVIDLGEVACGGMPRTHAYKARKVCHVCGHTYDYIGYDHPAGLGFGAPPCPQCSKNQ